VKIQMVRKIVYNCRCMYEMNSNEVPHTFAMQKVCRFRATHFTHSIPQDTGKIGGTCFGAGQSIIQCHPPHILQGVVGLCAGRVGQFDILCWPPQAGHNDRALGQLATQ